MSGIDKIIQTIQADTEKVCASVTNAAKVKADALIADAEAQAKRIVEDGKETTAARVAEIKKRGDSAAELEEKRVMLYTKQKIISDMLNEGLNAAKALPAEEYFALIGKMVAKNSQPGEGIIVFGDKDKNRLPAGFIDKLNQASKGKLTLSDDTADIDAGFILKYGGIEENCSFDAIFAGESENLCDKAGRLLF